MRVALYSLLHTTKPLTTIKPVSLISHIFYLQNKMKEFVLFSPAAVFKIYLRASFIIYLFAVLIVLYAVSKSIVKLLRSARGRPVPWVTPAHLDAKFIAALVQIFLYTFQVSLFWRKENFLFWSLLQLIQNIKFCFKRTYLEATCHWLLLCENRDIRCWDWSRTNRHHETFVNRNFTNCTILHQFFLPEQTFWTPEPVHVFCVSCVSQTANQNSSFFARETRFIQWNSSCSCFFSDTDSMVLYFVWFPVVSRVCVQYAEVCPRWLCFWSGSLHWRECSMLRVLAGHYTPLPTRICSTFLQVRAFLSFGLRSCTRADHFVAHLHTSDLRFVHAICKNLSLQSCVKVISSKVPHSALLAVIALFTFQSFAWILIHSDVLFIGDNC